MVAEQDQASYWTDYIFAGGKRIAKADLFDTRLHVSATMCNGCTGAYEVMNFTNIGDLNGHVIQAGDKLFVRQLIPTGMSGGVGFCFTDATCMIWYPSVVDQNGQLASWAAGTGSWQYRRIDLTPIAGHTINNAYMEIITKADGQPWHVYYDDVVVQWADGTVHPLYTRESSLSTSQYGTGQTNPTATVDISTASADVTNPAQTTYYYHGDQIGSSRLMTSGGGWPVWQGTFLPYGEEYNAQMGTNHYKFTGKERDSESGLDYFGARYYSNGLGRFVTPDPLLNSGRPWDPQTWNRYAYVRNNPLSRIDPTGLYDLNNTCGANDSKCNKQFNQHAKDLKQGLQNLQDKLKNVKDPAQKARLEASLKALGTEGDHNGVNVAFGATKGGGAGETEGVYDQKTGKETYNVTLDPSKLSSQNDYAVAGAHEGTHVDDIASYLANPSGLSPLSNFSLEYRGYQTSIYAASALGEPSISFNYDKKSYELWNGSWGAVDKNITNFVTKFHDKNGQPDHPETTPHNPWPN